MPESKNPAQPALQILEGPAPDINNLPSLGMDTESLKDDYRHYYAHYLGRDRYCRNLHYHYAALALTIRARLMERWKETNAAYDAGECKRAYYLSLEFLMGRALSNTLLSLGVTDAASQALYDLGLLMEDVQSAEPDAGLGNGGLGRLAACFLDSCATLALPVKGYGLRYEYGMFRQHIENGQQVEEPDHWLRNGNPWELERPEYVQRVHFYGRTEIYRDDSGRHHARWVDTHDVLAVPYDTPVPGYRNGTVNTLRLWKAAATDEFDLGEFNAGEYAESVAAKNAAENITMVLYPNDASENGKALRLKQQYFLASASLQDVMREWQRLHGQNFADFADRNVFQLNDTHPTIAVAELMRLLVDEYHFEWEEAWDIATRTMAYTNHTLLPEALEKWPARMFRELLPRLLDIIYEINARYLEEVSARWPDDEDRLRRMSIIEEGPDPEVRMAYLAIVGSMSVNGVAELHSQLLREGLFRDFFELWPEKFNNKTNGVTQRRWLAACNPPLSRLVTETIGDGWVGDLTQLKGLETLADDPSFQARWQRARQTNKVRLATLVRKECGVSLDPEALYDVQVKRIHEYKRQLLNILHVIHRYAQIRGREEVPGGPRSVIIGGKAAPGYARAKLIIKLINNVAAMVNADPLVSRRLQAVFLPNYRVSAMEVICPATDLSEQISTAGKEASGTGNMKFMMNGAVTIGTLDGANIEIREAAGDDNFFLFGLTAAQIEASRNTYNPGAIIAADPDLQRVLALLENGHFNRFEPELFKPIVDSIRDPHDPWMIAADFASYLKAQDQAAEAFLDRARWTRMSILNTARSGGFSTDRTIREYNADVWHLDPVSTAKSRAE
jgi:starch phosphorylase